MKARPQSKFKLTALLAATVALTLQGSAIGSDSLRLAGHVPHRKISRSRHLGRLSGRTPVGLAFSLKPRDPAGLSDLVRRLYDPADPEYQHFLTSTEFKDRFAPTDADVREVLAYLRAKGFSKATVHPNNLMIDAVANAATVESTFQVQLHEYGTNTGHVRAPLQEPTVSEDLASRIHGIMGLSSFRHSRPHLVKSKVPQGAQDPQVGGGFNAYMTPPKIKSAYNLSTQASAGAGETIALFELDGFNASDLTGYENAFAIAPPTVNTILVDGASGAPGADSDEVTLDIELTMAVSPAATIDVYEGPNTDAGVLDTYNRIASDNQAQSVSTSWGSPEDGEVQSYLDSEYVIFQQMAAQGQSVFAAAGDAGAYDDTDNPTLLTVDDPASQPYVTAVGGTTLSLAAGAYGAESSWSNSSNGQGGGGGVSAVWAMPDWQTGLATTASKGSNMRRMVPDVSLDANPNTGYSIYLNAQWYAVGGTSAAAPLWAAFAAQVNQARVAASLNRIGFVSPALYRLAQSSLFSSCFHDVNDGSSNFYFPATNGFDLSTGWGSMKGAAMLSALSAPSLPPPPPSTLTTSGSAGTVTLSWSAVTGAASYNIFRSAHFGGPYVNLGSQSGTSLSDVVGASGYYYYVTATNSAGTSGASPRRAGAAPLAVPGATGGLASSGAQ